MDTTPETNRLIATDQHHLEDDNFFPASVYWRMCDLARDLERERDEARRLAVEARDILDREGYQVNILPWEDYEVIVRCPNTCGDTRCSEPEGHAGCCVYEFDSENDH